MPYAIQVIMRFLHLSCMAMLLGGVAYWRMVLIPSTVALTAEERAELSERDAANFRPYVFAAVAGSIFSGIFNVLASPGHSPMHEIVFGVKMLLVAHVFVSLILAVRKGHPSRPRTLTSVLVAGAIIIVLSNYMKVFY